MVASLEHADISGVLFTADPITGSRMRMTGSFVNGSDEGPVSGEAEPHSFAFERPKGRYNGPATLKPYARKLHKLAVRLEVKQGRPQEIEWVVAGGRISLLRSRPIAALQGYDATTGDWNDSLTGDYLWSRNNFGEARPDVMSPFTYSLSEKVWSEISFLPGYHLSGNICGRYYANVSVAISMSMAMGKSKDAALEHDEGAAGQRTGRFGDPAGPAAPFDNAPGAATDDQAGHEGESGRQKDPRIPGDEPSSLQGAAAADPGDGRQGRVWLPSGTRRSCPGYRTACGSWAAPRSPSRPR